MTTAPSPASSFLVNGSNNTNKSNQSPHDVYVFLCDEVVRCKKNSYLLRALPTVSGGFADLLEIDLSLNFVGRLGIKAVLGVVRLAPRLERLCLADNWLNNDAVRDVVEALKEHRSVRFLDLSRNPISHTAGKHLADYASQSPALTTVVLDGTLINSALLRIIQNKVSANRQRSQTQKNDLADGSRVSHQQSSNESTSVAAPQPDTDVSDNTRWERSRFMTMLRSTYHQQSSASSSSSSTTATLSPPPQPSLFEAQPKEASASSSTKPQIRDSAKDAKSSTSTTSKPPQHENGNAITTTSTTEKPSREPVAQSLATLLQVVSDEERSQDFVAMALLASVAASSTVAASAPILEGESSTTTLHHPHPHRATPPSPARSPQTPSVEGEEAEEDAEEALANISCAEDMMLETRSRNDVGIRMLQAATLQTKPVPSLPGLQMLLRLGLNTDLQSSSQRPSSHSISFTNKPWYAMGLVGVLLQQEKELDVNTAAKDRFPTLSNILNWIAKNASMDELRGGSRSEKR